MTTLTYEMTPEFAKDLKRLTKRYRTLPSDLETLQKAAIELNHLLKIDNQACLEIPGCVTDTAAAFKVKKFPCRSLKGKGARSGLRLTYIFIPAEQRILLVELYYKGEQSNENRERILRYLTNC
jgi:hypothetical protein